MPKKPQSFNINVHLPENTDVFNKFCADFLYGISVKTMKKLPPDKQAAYADKYINAFINPQ